MGVGKLHEPYDFPRARKAIVAEVGAKELQRLHRTSRVADALAIVGLWSVFLTLVYLLGTMEVSLLWAACFVLQGFVIMAFGYMMHELFVHRFVGGKLFSRWMGLTTGLVSKQLPTEYAHIHRSHHLYTGTDPDEQYKQDLHTRLRRWFYITPVGYMMTLRRALKVDHPEEWPPPDGAFGQLDERDRKSRKVDRKFQYVWGALVVALIVLFPRATLLGYLVPLVFALPLANGLRLVLEHGETNPDNVYHCATYYRTGPISRVLFFWDAGDCHLVHPLFPTIPLYRRGAATKLRRPFLKSKGVRERRSLLVLCYGFFIRNEPHRALWSA